MVLQRLFGCKYLITVGTVIGESVWKMLALDVVAHIGFGRVGEGITDTTTGHPIFIQPYEAIEVLRLFYQPWKIKSRLLHNMKHLVDHRNFKQQKFHTSEDAFAKLS